MFAESARFEARPCYANREAIGGFGLRPKADTRSVRPWRGASRPALHSPGQTLPLIVSYDGAHALSGWFCACLRLVQQERGEFRATRPREYPAQGRGRYVHTPRRCHDLCNFAIRDAREDARFPMTRGPLRYIVCERLVDTRSWL